MNRAQPRRALRDHLSDLSSVFCIFLLCQPVLALLHALAYALTVVGLNAVLADRLGPLVQLALRDPRHTRIAVEALREIQPAGFAVGWPLGDLLSWLIPGALIISPVVATDRWASVVVQPGSTVLAGVSAQLLAATLLLALGRVFVHFRRKPERGGLVWFGVITQVGVAFEILRLPLTIDDLDAMGLSTFATKVFGASVPDYRAFLAPFELTQSTGIPVAPILLAVLVAIPVYLIPWVGVSLARLVFWIGTRPRSLVHEPRGSDRRPALLPIWRRAMLVSGVAVLTLSPLQWARGGPSFLPFPTAQGRVVAGVQDEPAQRYQLSSASPSVVEIAGEYPNYRLLVNGVRLQIRGVGYNVYASHLSREERAAHYARDFRLMRSLGFNTILGWEQSQFDEVLLDEAYEAGLWVVLPFQLPPQVEQINYADAGSRRALTASLREWVLRFKDHPALLMYAPGNEVLTAMRTYVPQENRQQQGFVAFYRELADLIHELDPQHPVICREAEVGHLDLLKEAFDDGVPRPWFVLGTNLYGSLGTFQAGLAQRAEWSWRLPGVITEFAPVGYRTHDRPHLVTQMARMTEATNLMGWVLYVWTIEGPEPLDRTFGIVDGYARPTDGTLKALSSFNLSRLRSD